MSPPGPLRYRRDLVDGLVPPHWPAGFTHRTLQSADAPEIHSLLTRAFDGNVADFDRWWSGLAGDPEFAADLCFLVHDRDGKLVGVAQCWTGNYLKDLAVGPEARRLGIGECLLRHVFATFRARGAASVDLKVDADNSTAIRLYERAGMRRIPIEG